MAVAFTKEEDAESQAANLPDRPISPHANFVTPEGLAQIEAALKAAREAHMAAKTGGDVASDRTAMARATRDLRYWSSRRGSAQLIETRPGDTVTFGCTVTILREDGRRQSFRIVGEDEADPKAGAISYASPLAAAVLGKAVGDEAEVAGAEVEIMEIR